MLKNYFKLAVRNLQKHKVFALINIAGLVIAFTSSIFIALFVLDELNYDGFHKNTDQIFRVRQKVEMFGFSPTTSWLLGEKLSSEFPEIKTAARVQPMDDPIYYKSGVKPIKEDKYLFADNSIFDIFNLPLKYGDTKSALTTPYSVVISKEMANKYFGKQNPLQQILHVNIRSKWYQLQVTGVLEDIPSNSDFNVNFIFSLSVLYEMNDKPRRQAAEPHPMENWRMISSYTYVLLNKSCKVEDLEEKLNKYFQKNLPGSYIKELKLEALSDIHLYKITNEGVRQPGAIIYIYLFSATGVLILLIAGINFIILSTANASVRAKEIGMRKVIGARRTDLIKQFLSESFLLAFLALSLALFAVELFMPRVSDLLNKHFFAGYFQLWQFILILFGITIFVGLFSGSYVAFYLSALSPITTIKNYFIISNSRGGFRKALIVTQFVIFVTLLVGSLVIYRQMHYISETNPGFNKEQLIAIDMGSVDFGKHFNAYKQDVMQNPGIVSISAGSTIPLTKTAMMFQSTSLQNNPGEMIQYLAGYVDYDFFKTLNAHIVQGRDFSAGFFGDLSESVIINQTAVQKFGLDNPVGSLISLQDGPKRVVGVVEDFIVSCYYETSPLVYYLKPGNPIIGTIILRLQPGNINTTLKYMERMWYKYAPNAVFNFQFVDEELNKQYANDLRFGKIITVFTGLAIFIASLGLFGLSLFMIKRKNKEIGIRKILGASIHGLIFIQTKEMIYLVIIGSIIAWPIAYYFMDKWLEDFAYKIEISWWMFALSGGIALLIALATVSFQAVKAATANPVESLKYE